MSVVDHFPGITWDDTRGMTLEEIGIIGRMIERKHRG